MFTSVPESQFHKLQGNEVATPVPSSTQVAKAGTEPKSY